MGAFGASEKTQRGVYAAPWIMTVERPDTGLSFCFTQKSVIDKPPKMRYNDRGGDKMKDLIWGAIGLIIAAFGGVFLTRELRLKNKGRSVLAEIASVREKKKRTYVHTLRFELDGKTIEREDRAGYSEPMKVGETKLIAVDPEKPEVFEYEDDLKKNITLTAAMIAVALAFSIRWLIAGLS